MRLDKFLQVSRLVKRRAIAKDLCDGGKVKLGGKTAKASSPVAVGDLLELTVRQTSIVARVLGVPDEKGGRGAREGVLVEIIRKNSITGD